MADEGDRRRFHAAFDRLEQEAIEAEFETGRREETVEEAKRHILVRIARVAAGCLVTIAGLAMLVLPGPGLVVIALGLALLAQDVPFARRLLDKVRARIPSDAEGNVSKPVLFGGLAVTVVAVCASVWWTFFR
ncbi:MAG TPA: PGPGW domain-containing protein [Acidimicrobiales bacterium]